MLDRMPAAGLDGRLRDTVRGLARPGRPAAPAAAEGVSCRRITPEQVCLGLATRRINEGGSGHAGQKAEPVNMLDHPRPPPELIAPRERGALNARRAVRLRGLFVLALLLLASLGLPTIASASSLTAGAAAFNREDYARAALILTPLATAGDPRAEAYLGFMYANGRGVVQSYEESALWYRRAAEQGFAPAQYMLGLMYDKAQGVPQDYVLAYYWVNLAVAGAERRERPYWTRVRDAISSKLSLAQLTLAQRLALGQPSLRLH
jgi:hypothetical protein